MFQQFYGLREQPFGVTPDPRFLYLGSGHREALASLHYGVEAGRGFVAMIAKPGMGKTTLLFQLLERLRGCAHTVFLFQTQCDSRELLRYLLTDAGLDVQEHDVVKLHHQFNQLLAREARSGKRFVVVIDEAQNLNDDALETVRLLSDFETGRAKLLQVILAGQPQLAEKLASPKLIQLRQRIAMLCRLRPLGKEETEEYIVHRLRAAGYQGPPLFTREALDFIAHNSQGIPRNINNLCFSAMSLGCALDRAQIGSDLLEEVTLDLDMETLLKEEIEPSATADKQNEEAIATPPPVNGNVMAAASISLCDRVPALEPVLDKVLTDSPVQDKSLCQETAAQEAPSENGKEWGYEERLQSAGQRPMRAIISTIAVLSLVSGLNLGLRLTKAAPQHYSASLTRPAIHAQEMTTVLLHRDGSRKPNLAHKGGTAQ